MAKRDLIRSQRTAEIEASNPLGRKRTADLLEKLRSLTKASRMLKAKVGAAAKNDEKSHRMRHPERRKSRDDS